MLSLSGWFLSSLLLVTEGIIDETGLEKKGLDQVVFDLRGRFEVHAVHLLPTFRQEKPVFVGHEVALAKAQGDASLHE